MTLENSSFPNSARFQTLRVFVAKALARSLNPRSAWRFCTSANSQPATSTQRLQNLRAQFEQRRAPSLSNSRSIYHRFLRFRFRLAVVISDAQFANAPLWRRGSTRVVATSRRKAQSNVAANVTFSGRMLREIHHARNQTNETSSNTRKLSFLGRCSRSSRNGSGGLRDKRA